MTVSVLPVVDRDGAGLRGLGDAGLDGAVDGGHQQGAAEALPEMPVDVTVHAGAAERVGAGAVERDDDALRRLGSRPHDEHALDALPDTAAEFADDAGAAIEQGETGLAHDVLWDDAGHEPGQGRVHGGLQDAGNHGAGGEQVGLVAQHAGRDPGQPRRRETAAEIVASARA